VAEAWSTYRRWQSRQESLRAPRAHQPGQYTPGPPATGPGQVCPGHALAPL